MTFGSLNCFRVLEIGFSATPNQFFQRPQPGSSHPYVQSCSHVISDCLEEHQTELAIFLIATAKHLWSACRNNAIESISHVMNIVETTIGLFINR